MVETKHENTDINAIALRIVQDVERIQHSCEWQAIGVQLVAIQRAAREIAASTALAGEGDGEAGEIAQGYHRAIEDQLEGIAALLAMLDGSELLDVRTIGLCEMLSTLASATLHKYSRAAIAAEAEAEWEGLVKEAEEEFLPYAVPLTPVRPLDVDGEHPSPLPSPGGRGGALEVDDEREVANG